MSSTRRYFETHADRFDRLYTSPDMATRLLRRGPRRSKEFAVSVVARRPSSSVLDIGCGYGDFLDKVRQILPDARGIEKYGSIFYAFQISKPDYIDLMSAEDLTEPVDVAFVGWMEPGQDFRRFVAKCS